MTTGSAQAFTAAVWCGGAGGRSKGVMDRVLAVEFCVKRGLMARLPTPGFARASLLGVTPEVLTSCEVSS